MDRIKKEENELISIIVPVYNGQKTIGRCIESICKQTYRNLEIIIIDDGSNDDTFLVVDDYKNRDNRIRHVGQKNQGVSATRNYGISIANGGYILFVDCDDYIAPQMIQEMYQLYSEEKSDLVLCGFAYVNGHRKENMKVSFSSQLLQKKIDFPIMKELYEKKILFAIGTKLYKKDLIDRYNIKFKKQNYLEDVSFCLEYIYICNSIYVSKNVHYFYTVNNTNSLSINNYKKNNIDLILTHLDQWLGLIRHVSYEEPQINDMCIVRILNALKNIYIKNHFIIPNIWKQVIQVQNYIGKKNITSSDRLQMSIMENKIMQSLIHNHKLRTMILLLCYKT